MNRRRTWAGVSAFAVLTLGLAACSSSDTSTGTETSGSAAGGKTEFNAAVSSVVNLSDAKGGVVNMANTDVWDSLDPGDTYYGYSWNTVRLYGRSLVMFKPGAGADSGTLVPDLA